LGGRDERLDENEKMKNPSATMQNYDTGSVASDQCVEISERKRRQCLRRLLVVCSLARLIPIIRSVDGAGSASGLRIHLDVFTRAK
jgi:hypothetical protein